MEKKRLKAIESRHNQIHKKNMIFDPFLCEPTAIRAKDKPYTSRILQSERAALMMTSQDVHFYSTNTLHFFTAISVHFLFRFEHKTYWRPCYVLIFFKYIIVYVSDVSARIASMYYSNTQRNIQLKLAVRFRSLWIVLYLQ